MVTDAVTGHHAEVSAGERFGFGANWARFLSSVDDEKIRAAEASLQKMLGMSSLQGRRFLDVGSGSGLSSLAAHNLGAEVMSFDYDPQSVKCTEHLKATYARNAAPWRVEAGSALDPAYLGSLGQFDVVYSWGVLHHTGAMWQALANMAPLVADNGHLFIAIYNDQGPWSRRWKAIKKTYNKLPGPLAWLFGVMVMGGRELKGAVGALVKLRPMSYVNGWRSYSGKGSRGMSKYYDLIDWIGGYPFEVAKPEQIFQFFKERGFQLQELRTCGGGIACNEYVFKKT